MNANEMRESLKKGALDERLISLYGNASLDTQRARYDAALKAFGDLYSPSCDGSRSQRAFRQPYRPQPRLCCGRLH